MYTGSGFSDWEIGDITVIIHNGVYHLYHLIIPNHDYIAHATSKDGISWNRVNNALFVGNPGEWDDDMLWTMHVCDEGGKFKMYYTGLQRKDRGIMSRVGIAESDNLVDWKKKPANDFPIAPIGKYYETYESNPRTWISFRDPFRIEYKNEVYLLVCARELNGPVSRRGCVGVIKISNGIEELPPLLSPRVYDDVECPCVFALKGRYYLIGSIREDIKIRYWFAPDLFGEYHSFHDDVLLPQGNYAARIVEDGEHMLIFNFFFTHGKLDSLRVLPPPKELDVDPDGRLILKSYYRWDKMATKIIHQHDFGEIKSMLGNPTSSFAALPEKWLCSAKSGYEIFTFQRPSESFIWEGEIHVEGMGKLGLVSDLDDESNGYFISFDVVNGLIQIRAWGFNPLNHRQNFIFNNIQAGIFPIGRTLHFRLIRSGHYIEISVNGAVKLTLMDYTYTGGRLGLYSASSIISLQNSIIKVLPNPQGEYASQEDAQKLPEPQG